MTQVKRLTTIFALLLGLGVHTANAALIDQGDITYDDVNNTEWLDLSLTDGMSFDAAMAAYSADGWTIATESEYQAMFDSHFIGFDDGGASYLQVANGTALADQASVFTALFGLVYENATLGASASYGLYLENTPDGDLARLGGMYHGSTVTNIHRDNNGDYSVYGADGFANAGIFLVRAASVPEASTLVMFAIGLLGLGFSRRKFK